MLYREIGKTGVSASILGFGAMRLPTLGAPDAIDKDKTTELIHTAIESGVNYVDTAWFYHAKDFGSPGESEPAVGEALQGGWRDRVHLATKLPQQLITKADEMRRYLEKQLERLQTDHLDFYLVHGMNGPAWDKMRDLGVREFLDDVRSEGLIRHAAFSFHGAAPDFPRIIDEYDGWAFGQLQFNYMDTRFQAGIEGLRYAASKGIGVVVMEPLKGGKLAKEIPPQMQSVFDARPEGWSPAHWALRYVWNEPGVSLALSGMGAMEQLRDNLAAAEEGAPGSLTDEQLAVFAEVEQALTSRTKVDCTACRYCMPCPSGVDIPGCFSAVNAATMWNDPNPWLTGYVRTEGKASLCSECGQCEDACPQGLPIRELLKDVAQTFGE